MERSGFFVRNFPMDRGKEKKPRIPMDRGKEKNPRSRMPTKEEKDRGTEIQI